MSDTPLTALIIGAGFAGICSAIKLREAGIDNFVIVEKSSGIGGTWFDNTYPGAACDVPSHLYSFSFAPNPNWSRRYSPSAEIQTYIESVAREYKVAQHIQNNIEIISARFKKETALWHVKSADGQKFIARFLLTSVGILNTPELPKIDGRSQFQGSAFHSARWDHTLDFKGKRVAIVGSAASALQIIPEIVNKVSHLDIYQRTANYVIPRKDRAYTKFEKFMFRVFPWTMKFPRLSLKLYLDHFYYHNFKQGHFIHKEVDKTAKKFREKSIMDPQILKTMTPDYPIGCKRILVSDDFYDAIQKDNVNIVSEGIKKITKDSIQTNTGMKTPADIIIYATGFKSTTFMPHMKMSGINGATLAKWRKNPKALKGLTIENMPNAFFLLGPNTNLGHSSMILMIEAQVKYLVQCMQATPKGKYFTVKSDVVEKYNTELQGFIAKSIWVTGCQSWYLTPDGSVPTMWPHNTSTFAKLLKTADMDEYELQDAG